MLLADIGNSRIHIYDGEKIEHLDYESAFKKYGDSDIFYISVQHRLKERLKEFSRWVDISDRVNLYGSYPTMGVDRKALCLSHESGLFISAGSAITVDIVENGFHKGGFILLGIKAYLKAYRDISRALDINLNRDIEDRLRKDTTDSLATEYLLNHIRIENLKW